MAKKKDTRVQALNQLKSLESKWLKDPRVDELYPVQAKVMAGKVAALLEHFQQNRMNVDLTMWPLLGAEELVKMDEVAFKQALADLQTVGVLTSTLKFTQAAGGKRAAEKPAAEGGVLHYRCAKAGGVNIADRDEYIPEDQEVEYTEDEIADSPNLQTAIANEWLVRLETKN
jgi:hypothetical protein